MTLIQFQDFGTLVLVPLAMAHVLRTAGPLLTDELWTMRIGNVRSRIAALREFILLAALPAFMCHLIVLAACRLML